MPKLTIAIDGPAGSGKSSVARLIANALGYLYLDSGAMYRALALKALQRHIPIDDEAQLEKLANETHIELKLAFVEEETGFPSTERKLRKKFARRKWRKPRRGSPQSRPSAPCSSRSSSARVTEA